LKRYHPAEFLASLINNQPMGFYAPHVLVHEAKRRGIAIRPPSINGSEVPSTVPRPGRRTVQIGLGQVDGLSDEQAAAIVAERAVNGPYRSLGDFVRRVALPVELTSAMIRVGIFDEFGLGRREALWQLGLYLQPKRFGPTNKRIKARKPGKLSGTQLALPLPVARDVVALAPMPVWDRMAADYAVLGLSPRYHPLGLMRPELPDDLVRAADLEQMADGAIIRIGGLVVVRQRPETAKGVTFLLLEDESGLMNAVVYPRLYDARRHLVRGEPYLLIVGRVQRQGKTINVVALAIEELAKYRQPNLEDMEKPQASLKEIAPVAHSYR
jgi:error-prone DNA polymerase